MKIRMAASKIFVLAVAVLVSSGFTACKDDLTKETSVVNNQTPVAGDYRVTGRTHTYDGNFKSATVTPKPGKSPGTITVLYNGSNRLPRDAGSYTVTFDVAAAAGWNAANGLPGGTLVINPNIPGNQTPALGDYEISGLTQTYDGSPRPVTITPKAGKSSGDITIYYDGLPDAPSDVGEYDVTFDVEPTDGWNAASGLVAGSLIINPDIPGNQTPALGDYEISGLTQTYDGSPKAVTITPKDGKSGGNVIVYYNGLPDVPSAAGEYDVTFSVEPADGWNAASGLQAGTLIINANIPGNQTPAPGDYNISGLAQTYDGSPKAVTITPKADKSGGNVTVYYNGSPDVPIAAGEYDVTFNVAVADGWNAASGLAAGTLVINPGIPGNQTPAASDYNISGLEQTYDGYSKTVTITPKADKSPGTRTIFYDGSTTAPSDAGEYSVTFSVAATDGWNAASGLQAGTLVITDNADSKMRLWYTYPAETWMTQALPIGNGELGAMFFGGIQREHIQFNEKTLWAGSTTNKQGGYQNFGDLYIDMASHETTGVSDYRRELSISNAVGSVSYTADGVSYKREYFSSFPDKVIVMRFTTPGNEGSLTLTADLIDAHPASTGASKTAEGNAIVFSGKLLTVSYAARLVVLNEGGTVTAENGKLRVERADAVTFLLAAATNYDLASSTYTTGGVADVQGSLQSTTTKAAQKTYAELKGGHLADYRPLFNRVTLDLRETEPAVNTQELVSGMQSSKYLDMLYFQFGRYLMIASSRGMNVPNNLQGIWNHINNPPWESDLHPNINLQMNYWPAEVTNLSECHMPLLNYVATESMKAGSRWRTLASGLGHRGWTVLTQATIFGYTSWGPNYVHNGWLCMHLWQHYAYTRDENFLRNTAWPSMKSACEFWFDRLIVSKSGDGTLEAPDGWSPEQGNPVPTQDGVPYEQQLIWELFDKTLKALDILGGENAFRTELQDKFNRLDKGLHSEYPEKPGLLAEYKYSGFPTLENQHRHISHLVGLYPGDQITPDKTPYFELARASANDRGNGGTGWSRAWKINFWARLKDGNRAHTLLKSALQYSRTESANSGIYENLLDAHPPFQIDGNFGATAGIAEMLIQSHRGYIELLPALPSAWSSGSFKGLKAQGNFTVDLEWAGSAPTSCTVYSGSGGTLDIRFGNTTRTMQTGPGGSYPVSF